MRQLHIDLRHVSEIPETELRVRIGAACYPIQRHDKESLDTAINQHLTLMHLPSDSQTCFTHWCEIEESHFTQEVTQYVHIEKIPAQGMHLGQLVAAGMLWPEAHLRTFWQNHLEFSAMPMSELRRRWPNAQRRPRLHSAKLGFLKMRKLPVSRQQAIDVLVQAQTLLSVFDSACTLVSYHPNLANIQPSISSLVHNQCIAPDSSIDANQYNNMQTLANAISAAGSNWAPVVPCVDSNNNQITAQYPIAGAFNVGDPLHTWSLADGVMANLGPCVAGANRLASNNSSLMNHCWRPANGLASLQTQSSQNSMLFKPEAQNDIGYKWALHDAPQQYGVEIDFSSLQIDGGNNFSIGARNTYMRSLFCGYELFDDRGNSLGGAQKLFSISSTSNIMGYPIYNGLTPLAFNIGNASSVNLYFGSMGTSNWVYPFSFYGEILTTVFDYGIPIILIVANKFISNCGVLEVLKQDKGLMIALIAAGAALLGDGFIGASALGDTELLAVKCANIAVGAMLSKGCEALGAWLLTQISASQISAATGPVGLALKCVSAMLTLEQLTVTTAEICKSPACVSMRLSRAIDVSLTMHPDPAHGEAGNPESAIWPSVGRSWQATLQYKGGTSRILSGSLPSTSSNTPVPLFFSNLPAGGQFRILFSVYSASGWQAGVWQSDWITAMPNSGTQLALGDKQIKEILVPLSGSTQYLFQQKIGVQSGQFVWQNGTAPQATRGSLSCGNGGTICELVDISINNSAFQVGYAWRASGQNIPANQGGVQPSNSQVYVVQNLSVLTSPSSHWMRADIGYTNRPLIAYAPSSNSAEIDQTNFVLDPRSSTPSLRQAILNSGNSFDLGQSALSFGALPLPNADSMAVHHNGYVVACSWQADKLMVVPLANSGTSDTTAPMGLMLCGQGTRAGLLDGPKAVAVTADGRILVLETGKKSGRAKISAYDVHGSPVACFPSSSPSFSLNTNSVAGYLDQQQIPPALADTLISNGIGYQFYIDSSFTNQLNSGSFAPQNDPLISKLAQNSLFLAYDPANMQDSAKSARIQVVTPGQSWLINDPRGDVWQIQAQGGTLNVYRRLSRARIQVVEQGRRWLLSNADAISSFDLRVNAGSGQTDCYMANTSFPLKTMGNNTWLDLAVEARGYIYVLSMLGDGSATSNWIMDVYAPDGNLLFRTPDASISSRAPNIVAEKFTVDIWRNVFALCYESLTSPMGTVQPVVAQYSPNPPLFSCDASNQADLNNKNIGVVIQLFSKAQIYLSSAAYINVVDPQGIWQVVDGSNSYYLYRVGSLINVYATSV